MTDEAPRVLRASSERAVALRAERLVVAPFEKAIGSLQQRVVFLAASLQSHRLADAASIASAYDLLLADVVTTTAKLDAAMEGQRGIGPADNCRSALTTLRSRIGVAL